VENSKETTLIYKDIRKIKAAQYLALHRMKSELGSFGRVVDVFIEMNMPAYNTFIEELSQVYDYEIVNRCMNHVSIICDGWKKVKELVDSMHNFVETRVRHLPNRKEQAKVILDSYGTTNRASYLFSILDEKPLEKDHYKKLLYQLVREPEERELIETV
jgi:hypothetical protein